MFNGEMIFSVQEASIGLVFLLETKALHSFAKPGPSMADSGNPISHRPSSAFVADALIQ